MTSNSFSVIRSHIKFSCITWLCQMGNRSYVIVLPLCKMHMKCDSIYTVHSNHLILQTFQSWDYFPIHRYIWLFFFFFSLKKSVQFQVRVSAKGSITNVEPRRHFPKLLYLRLFIFILEMFWSALGAYWVFREIETNEEMETCDESVILLVCFPSCDKYF